MLFLPKHEATRDYGIKRALKIESNAELTTIKGLGRRFAWSDLLRQTSMFNDMYEPSMPCGCYDGD